MKEIQQKLDRIESEIKENRTDASLWNERGVGYHLLGEYATAIESLQHALGLDRHNPVFHFNLANSLMEHQQVQPAIEHYLAALDQKPDYIPALTNLADAYECNRQPGKACELFQYLTRIDPDNPLAHFNLGNHYLRQNHHIEAAKCYEKTIEMDKTFTDAYFNISWILNQVNAKTEALSWAKKGLGVDPEHKELRKLESQIENREPDGLDR